MEHRIARGVEASGAGRDDGLDTGNGSEILDTEFIDCPDFWTNGGEMDLGQLKRERRFRRYSVPLVAVLCGLITGNVIARCRVVKGIPADATLLKVDYDPWDDMLRFTFASETFSPVPEGVAWESEDIVFEKL